MREDQLIELDHISTRFGNRVVHEDISLTIGRGEIVGLVGGSGSGKTTLMRTMIGLQQPSDGQASLFGNPINRISHKRLASLHQRCGILFQGGALFSALSVFDNIAFPLRESRFIDETLIAQLVCMKLSMVGLDATAAKRLPAELSGGMVKRAALARALALEPELLFLDEPTSGLDPIASEGFVRLVSELHQELGFTVVMITHDLDVMHDLCSRIIVLADRRVVADGDDETVRNCDHPFVREFFHGIRGERVFAHPAVPEQDARR